MKAAIGREMTSHEATPHEVHPKEVMQWVDGELPAERATAVASHVSRCGQCRGRMDDLHKVSRKLASWTVPSAEEMDAQLEALRTRTRESGRWSRVQSVLRPAYMATACAVILALTILAQLSPSRIHLQEPEIRAKLKKTASPNPPYPEEARRNGIQGQVRIHIVVARDGSVKHLRAVSGDPILAKAAVDGVRKWKFEPTVVDGKAVEVESEVKIDFTLSP